MGQFQSDDESNQKKAIILVCWDLYKYIYISIDYSCFVLHIELCNIVYRRNLADRAGLKKALRWAKTLNKSFKTKTCLDFYSTFSLSLSLSLSWYIYITRPRWKFMPILLLLVFENECLAPHTEHCIVIVMHHFYHLWFSGTSLYIDRRKPRSPLLL